MCGPFPLECLHLCPTFENLDAELSGKENHPHNELRFPHFFEGCVLRVCVRVCVRACVGVCVRVYVCVCV